MTIYEEYFEWIYQFVNGKGYSKVLEQLYLTDFIAVLPLDDNRKVDGCELRYRFGDECFYPKSVILAKFDNERCSILEMMVGLAIRIEDTIMSDSDFGDRTIMWFWMMMKSLGLYGMTDDKYDEEYVDNVIHNFLYRGYDPNGKGGLFTVNDTYKDMRDIEIWYQMCLFFDHLL